MTGWKLTARAARPVVEAALAAHGERDEEDGELVIGAREDPAEPSDWLLEAWLSHRPTRRDRDRIAALFGQPSPELVQEKLPETDWIAASQQSAEPVRAGPFRIRTPDFAPSDEAGLIEFVIPAAQAFGTGQHATTAGCLEMLARMKRRGVRPRNLADIGSGTGILAFAALALWPRAHANASDSDPVCLEALFANARRNAIALGEGRGELACATAEGVAGRLHARRTPYDLVIANILARPLITLARDFARHTSPGADIVLAGPLDRQFPAVEAAYRRAGFHRRSRLVRGEWVILWLRKHSRG